MKRHRSCPGTHASEQGRERTLDHLLLGSTFVLTLLLSLRRMADSDLWAHLKCGEYLFRHGNILTTHYFNCSWPDFPYVNHSWLFQAVIYVVNVVSGEAGLVALQVVLILLAFFLLFRILRSQTDSIAIIALVLSLGILASSHRFSLRPQHFTFCFLLFFLYSLDQCRQGNGRPVKFLPLIMLVWANMHAECLWGVLVTGVFLAVHWFDRSSKDPNARKRLMLIFGVVLLSALANPFTWKTVLWPFFVMKEQFAGVEEILPPLGSRFLFFYMYFGLTVFAISLNYRHLDPFWLTLTGLFTVVAWTANRGIPHFVFVSAPLVAANLSAIGRRYGKSVITDKKTANGIRYALLAVLIAIIVSIVTNPFYLKKYDNIPYPEHALNFIAAKGISGNVFNEHIWGGYIIWKTFPRLRPYIDGRFFHKRFYEEYYPLLTGQPGWGRILDKYGINIVILSYSPSQQPRLNDRLFSHAHWRLVYWDDVSLVYIKDTKENGKVLEEYGNDVLNPDRDLFAEHMDKSLLAMMRLREIAERNLQAADRSFKALIVSANAWFLLGEFGKARERFEASLEFLGPHDPRIYYKIALCHRALGDLEKTEEYLTRVLAIVPDSKVAGAMLSEVRYLRMLIRESGKGGKTSGGK